MKSLGDNYEDRAVSLLEDQGLRLLERNFSGKVGEAIASVAYAPAVQAESPDLKRPVLRGATRGGRLAIVYSPYGLSTGLDGIRTYGARSLSPDDANRVATNILLYIFNY